MVLEKNVRLVMNAERWTQGLGSQPYLCIYAQFFLPRTADGHFGAFVEIGMCRNKYASDYLIGFAGQIRWTTDDKAAAQRKRIAGCVGILCKGGGC